MCKVVIPITDSSSPNLINLTHRLQLDFIIYYGYFSFIYLFLCTITSVTQIIHCSLPSTFKI